MEEVTMLSLDTSSFCTGYAVWQNGGLKESGIIDLHKDKQHWQNMKRFLIGLMAKIQPDIVVVEHTSMQRKHFNAATLINLSQLIGVVEGWTIANNADFVQLYPSEWRSRIGTHPSGREECKAWAVETVKERFHIECLSDDEADAILIGQAWINYFDKGEETT